MQKNVLVLSLILVMLVLVSCNGVQDSVDLGKDVYVGTEGLRMRFVPDVPRPLSYSSSGETFEIALEMENQGTYPLRGMLYFSGHDQRIIQGLPSENGIVFPTVGCTFPDIIPRSKGNPFGGLCIAEFRPILNLYSVADSYKTNLLATAIYEYATNAQVDFCVDPLPNRFRTSPQACVMQPVGVGGGQGAPVAVTRVEANAIGRGQVLYRITIQNQGIGTVVNPRIRPSQLRPTDVGELYYRVAVPGDVSFGANYASGDAQGGFSVSNSGAGNVYFNSPDFYFNQFFRSGDSDFINRVRLNNGQGIITVIVDYRTVENAFRTPLQVILSYGYMQQQSIPIEIVNVDSYAPEDIGGRIVVNTDSGTRIEYDRRGIGVSTSGGGGVQISDVSRLI